MTDQAPGTIDGQAVIELPAIDPVSAPAPDAKPRRTRGRTAAAKEDKAPRAARPRAAKTPPLAPRLTTGLVTVGTIVGMVNEFDGLAICKGAPAFAGALAEAAEENPKLKEALERMLTVGTFGKVFAAGAAIGVPIAANHGLIPMSLGGLFGAPPVPEGERAAAA